MKQQTLVTTIRSYLKLYSTISTAKLSNFLKADDQGAQEADQIKTYLTYLQAFQNIYPLYLFFDYTKNFVVLQTQNTQSCLERRQPIVRQVDCIF